MSDHLKRHLSISLERERGGRTHCAGSVKEETSCIFIRWLLTASYAVKVTVARICFLIFLGYANYVNKASQSFIARQLR